jgi:hypothetical protein
LHSFHRAAFLKRVSRFGTNLQHCQINRQDKTPPIFNFKADEKYLDVFDLPIKQTKN